jgi:alpha-galactosidase
MCVNFYKLHGKNVAKQWHVQLAVLSREEVEIITNTELIAFHQDTTFGKPAFPFTPSNVVPTNPPQFYSGRSSKGIHVFIVNTNDDSTTFKIDFVDVPGLKSNSAVVHHMWKSTDLGTFSTSYDVTLAAHDTAALLLTPP